MTARRSLVTDGSVYRKTELRNGLRIVTETLPAVRSVAIGVWIDVGSRHETPEENGLSHFVEHMLFKGSKNRTAKELASSLENLGGSLNGFTSREQTCYYARVLDEHLPMAVEVLADLTCNPTLTATHVNREKQVVCEEIKEALDNPSDKIHDVFSRTFWGKHPLGQPIMGSQENIRSLTRPRVVDFVKKHYRSGSIVIAACGSVDHDRLVKMVRKYFHFTDGMVTPPIQANPPLSLKKNIERNDNKQTNLCMGFPALAYESSERMVMLALSSYLGGGMSSVLFQKIREDRGLAYSVYSFNDFYRDTGIFGIYLGTDSKHLRKAVDVVLTEARLIKRNKLTSSQLGQLKSQLKGHLILSQESTNSRMNRLARQELLIGGYQPLTEMVVDIEEVSAKRIQDLAHQVLDESRAVVAVLGPVGKGALDGAI
ncbi:MAG: insulinase family protein [candidate division Zixibacteria bacterium]|nr:insulinase family protein [candidate division Zixibacteria bacterium]